MFVQAPAGFALIQFSDKSRSIRRGHCGSRDLGALGMQRYVGPEANHIQSSSHSDRLPLLGNSTCPTFRGLCL